MSSFISGIETDISNFFSGVSDQVNGVINFGTNIASSIHQAVQGVINGIASIGNGLINGIKTFGTDIIDALSNTAFAIWHGLVSFGSIIGGFFQTAMHTLSSAIYGAFTKIHDALIDAWKNITNAFNTFVTNFINAFNDFRADLLKVAGIFVDIYNDIKPILVTIWNNLVQGFEDFFLALPNFATDIFNFFNGLVTGFNDFINDILYMPEDLSKYVAGKTSSVLSRLVDFNVLMETVKHSDRVASNMAIKSPGKAMLYKLASPFIGLIAGAIAKAVIDMGYSEFSQVSGTERKTVTPPQTNNVFSKYSLQYNLPQVNSNTVPKPSHSETTPVTAQYISHYVVGAREDDILALDNNVTLYNKLVSPYPNTQVVVDQLGVIGSIVQITRPAFIREYEYVYAISTFFAINALTYKSVDTVPVNSVIGVFKKTYIPGLPICPTVPSELSLSQPNEIYTYVYDCLPIQDVNSSQFNLSMSYSTQLPAIYNPVFNVKANASYTDYMPSPYKPADIIGLNMKVSVAT